MDAIARVEDVPGWLRPEDASKLYELVSTTDGPVLEIGTYRGKSAIVMALARSESGRSGLIFTIDVDRNSLRLAYAEALRRGVADRIVFIHGTLEAFARGYPQVRPAVVFIDGDHTLAGVTRDLVVLERIVPARARLLFHDFADPRNDDPSCHDTKVRPTVETSWVATQCDFLGAFGVCGLYRRRTTPEFARAPIADLMPLASPREQYVHRLKTPFAKVVRRMAHRTRKVRSI